MPSPPTSQPVPRVKRRPARHNYPVLALRPLAASMLVHLALGLPIALAVLALPTAKGKAVRPSSVSVEINHLNEAWELEEWSEELESQEADAQSTLEESIPQLVEDILETFEPEAPDFMPTQPLPLDLAFTLKPRAASEEVQVPNEEANPKTPASDPSPAPSAGDRNPVLLESPAPSYPRLARRSRWEGVVLCKLSVSASGHVTQVVVERSSGRRVLDEAAVSALLRWRFKPGLRNGSPAEHVVLHRVSFQLD